MRPTSWIAFAIAATASLFVPSAQATTFSFDDEYYLTASTFTGLKAASVALFGTSNGMTTFTKGVWQGNGNCSGATCPGSTQVVNIGGTSGNVSGEWAVSNNVFQPQFLSLIGWTANNTNSSLGPVGSTFNTGLPANNGAVLYMQYQTGGTPGTSTGTTTPFTLNSLNLKAPLVGQGVTPTITLDGYLGLTKKYSATLTLTGSFQTFTENWTGIDTLYFDPPTTVTGTNGLALDNVVINQPVPEPAGTAVLGIGLLSLGAAIRRRYR